MTSTIPHVDPALPGLSIAQATRAEPFLLEGDRVRFAGHQTRSGGQVLFRSPAGTADMTAGLRAEGLGHAANLVLYPGVARRDFTGPRGSMVETVVTPRTLPRMKHPATRRWGSKNQTLTPALAASLYSRSLSVLHGSRTS